MKIDSTLFLQNLKDLRSFINRQNSVEKGDDEDFYIQERLDRLHYYVKHIPKDKNNIFKAISDSLHFSIANWEYEKSFMQKTITSCLESENDDYNIKGLAQAIDKNSLLENSEIIILLACYFYKRNLKLLGFDTSCSLEELDLDLGFSESFVMSIIGTDLTLNEQHKANHIAHYDILYSKSYISTAKYCQKILHKLVDNALKAKHGGEASLNNTLEHNESLENDEDEEEPIIYQTGYVSSRLDHIIEQSDEESHDYGSNDSMDYYQGAKFEKSNGSHDGNQDTEANTDHKYASNKEITLAKPEKERKGSLGHTNRLNKNARSFKPKVIKSHSSNVSDGSACFQEVEASPEPQWSPSYENQGYYEQPSPQEMYPSYMQPQPQYMPTYESGMLISYHSSSMMGIIQSIPSGEQVFVEIGELSSMGIGIDFLYNLARIRLLCSFQKKYVYDQNYAVRAMATNMKILSIDVIQA